MIVSERSEFVGKARICRCPCVRNTHDMASLMTNFTDQKTRNLKLYYKGLRASRFSPAFLRLKLTFIFNSLLVNHTCICRYYCLCVRNTDIALFMTSYTDQESRNLRTSLNDCEPKISAFSRLKFVGKITYMYMSGQFRAPPPPPNLATSIC